MFPRFPRTFRLTIFAVDEIPAGRCRIVKACDLKAKGSTVGSKDQLAKTSTSSLQPPKPAAVDDPTLSHFPKTSEKPEVATEKSRPKITPDVTTSGPAESRKLKLTNLNPKANKVTLLKVFEVFGKVLHVEMDGANGACVWMVETQWVTFEFWRAVWN